MIILKSMNTDDN